MRQLKGSHVTGLAGIRGVAAAVVLLSHIVQIHFLRFVGLGSPLHNISSAASEYAVIGFFILSGYLITHTLEANIKRNGLLRLDIFLAARIARIYPPFIFAIGISLIVYTTMAVLNLPGYEGPMRMDVDLYSARETVKLSLGEVTQALAMQQGMLEINGALWSLYIEAKLYILFACALGLAAGNRRTLVKALLAGTLCFFTYKGIEKNPGFAAYAIPWLVGATAYYLWNIEHNRNKRVLLCLALIMAAEATVVLIDGTHIWTAVRDTLAAASIAWLLFGQRLSLPGPTWLANCSYSLYATHFPIILLAQSLLIRSNSFSIAESVGVAVLSTITATAVGLIGGQIEAQKPEMQKRLLTTIEYLHKLGARLP